MTVCYFYGVAVPRHQSASHHIGFSQACPALANNISSQIIFCDEKKPKYDFYSVHKSTLLYRWVSENFGRKRKKSNLQRTNGTVKTFSSKGQLWPFLTASIFIFVGNIFYYFQQRQSLYLSAISFLSHIWQIFTKISVLCLSSSLVDNWWGSWEVLLNNFLGLCISLQNF